MEIARRTFASDNCASVHPDVLAAMAAVNGGHAPAYGADPVTAEAIRLLRGHFGPDAEVFFAFNGTGANVVGLQSMLRPYECILTAGSAHINVDECGAPERFLGSKIVAVPAVDGKLDLGTLESAVVGVGDQHRVQPRVVSVSQATELGTCYSVGELTALGGWAHDRGMLLHVDGARLANAAVWEGRDLGDFGVAAGVDVLSFGATKNGAMGAEAVVVLRPDGAAALPFIRKQAMQLASKMRYVAAQFVAMLSDDLWRRNAEHANAMAARLAAGVADVPGVTLTYPVQSNAVFAGVPAEVRDALQRDYPFYVWDEATGVVRWMASFDLTADDVDGFVARLAELAAAR
ncbi:MAG: threonine aldolase family protein [Acidimicrobiales bacterium]